MTPAEHLLRWGKGAKDLKEKLSGKRHAPGGRLQDQYVEASLAAGNPIMHLIG